MQTQDMVKSQAGAIVDAGTLKAEFVANGYVIKAFQTGWAPTPLSVAADFDAHECDFTGYASQTVGGAGRLWSAIFIDAEGRVVFASPNSIFQATDAVAPNQVGGYWIENTAGDVRKYALFTPPIPLISALAAFILTIYEQGDGPGYSDVDN